MSLLHCLATSMCSCVIVPIIPGIMVQRYLVSEKICKIFQIPRHIESLDVCMEY